MKEFGEMCSILLPFFHKMMKISSIKPKTSHRSSGHQLNLPIVKKTRERTPNPRPSDKLVVQDI
jgi:hypothetical protein